MLTIIRVGYFMDNNIKKYNMMIIEEQLAKYPRLKTFRNQYLFVTDKEINEIRDSHYESLLKEILSDDRYYDYTVKIFSNAAKEFKVGCIRNGDISRIITLGYRVDVFNIIKDSIDKGIIVLNEESKKRYNELFSLVSYSGLKEKNKNNVYEVNVQKELYTIPIKLFFDFLESSEESYETFFKDDRNDFCSIDKRIFIYGLIDFFNKNNILKNYIVPSRIRERYKEISSYQKIDIESFFRKEDEYSSKYFDLNEVTIEQGLREEIFKGMDDNFTPLQKAIYIYIKMCMLLSYDEEYFVYDQTGDVTLKHKDIRNLSNINLKHNEVVCYEFNALYAKFLTELGIDYEIDGNISCEFGDGHQSLIFYCDKFIVSADSVTTILEGDLINAKINNKLQGINCLNENQSTKKEFETLVDSIYKLIIDEQKDVNKSVSDFDNLIDVYKTSSENRGEVKIPLEEKIHILIDKVNNLKKSKVDAVGYISNLKHIIFNEYELRNNFQFSIIRKNESLDTNENKASLCSIFTLNFNNIYAYVENNIYFMYVPYGELKLISIEQLNDMFLDGTLSYMEKSPKIPGVIKGNRKK